MRLCAFSNPIASSMSSRKVERRKIIPNALRSPLRSTVPRDPTNDFVAKPQCNPSSMPRNIDQLIQQYYNMNSGSKIFIGNDDLEMRSLPQNLAVRACTIRMEWSRNFKTFAADTEISKSVGSTSNALRQGAQRAMQMRHRSLRDVHSPGAGLGISRVWITVYPWRHSGHGTPLTSVYILGQASMSRFSDGADQCAL
jgi:hypothetical protein